MNWTLWRLHRNQVIFASSALAAIGVFLLVTGIHIGSVYDQALSVCGATNTCSTVAGQLVQHYRWLWTLAILTVLLPALFGVFWGAPLLAKEVEEGTHKLIWTQTVTRRHWLGVNLGWILLTAAAWGAAIAGLLTWWLKTENAVQLDRFEPGHFEIQGIVPIAYSVFGVSLGIAAGARFRRVLPAAATTLAGYTIVRFMIQHFVRPRYLTPVTRAMVPGSQMQFGPPAPAGSWILSPGDFVNAAGNPIGFGLRSSEIPAACRTAFGGGPGHLFDCLAQQGWHVLVTYQPADRFWTFQWIESAIFVVFAGILVALASWRILTADA